MAISIFTGFAAAHNAALTANEARSKASEAKSATFGINFEIERLLMITEALWTILKESHDYTDEDLLKHIKKIDMQDGKLDGRVAPKPTKTKCPSCKHDQGKKRAYCIYCGHELNFDPFER